MLSVAAFEAATWVKSMYMTKSLFKNRKKKVWKSKKFLHQSPFNRWFRNGIHSLLSRVDVRGSADIILPHVTHIATL